MPPQIRYPDFVTTPSGLQYKDFREGSGEPPEAGDTVVLDWAGVTIGYYGRPFEARRGRNQFFDGLKCAPFTCLLLVLAIHCLMPDDSVHARQRTPRSDPG